MRSRWFNLLVAVSMVLCLASILLWAGSYRGAEHFSRTQLTIADATKTAARTHHLQWSQGLVQFWILYQMRTNTEPYIAFLGSDHVPRVPTDLLPLNTGPMTPELSRARDYILFTLWSGLLWLTRGARILLESARIPIVEKQMVLWGFDWGRTSWLVHPGVAADSIVRTVACVLGI